METQSGYDDKERLNSVERKFTFVDQTDRSQKAATAHKAVIRSHCMTEVRRQKRVQAPLEKRSDSNVAAFAIGRRRKRPSQTWSGVQIVLPNTSALVLRQEPSKILNPSCPVGELPAQAVDSDKIQDFHASSSFQTLTSWPEHPPWADPERPIVNTEPSWAQESNSQHLTLNLNTDLRISRRRNYAQQTGQGLSGEYQPAGVSPTILGISRVDPFCALPIDADRAIHHLIDHYNVTIPFLIYGTRTRNPVQHQLYNIATQDPAAFHAMLAYSARQFDSINGSQASQRALVHSSRTLQLVYERIRKLSFKCDNGLVMAVALLAFSERRFGDEAIARQHWLALREMLMSRSGLEALQLNRWLAATLYWNCLVWSSTPDHSSGPKIDWTSIIDSNKPSLGISAPAKTSQFLANLEIAKARILHHIDTGCSNPCLYSCLLRRSVFSPAGPLLALLAPKIGNPLSSTNVQRTASACQLPCILYLSIVVSEYETDPARLQHYLGRLMVCIYDDGLDIYVSAEQLLIKLLSGLEEGAEDLTRRAHQTIRMLGVVKGWGERAVRRVERQLVDALVVEKTTRQDGDHADDENLDV